MYQVILTPKAKKSLKKLPSDVSKRIIRKIFDLADNPRGLNTQKIQGSDFEWRLRVGDYRVIYEIHDDVLKIKIIRVAHRQGAYKK